MGLPNIIQQINSKLPLSGGTMSGAIKGKSGMLFCSVDDLDIFICGGTKSSNNSYIQLNGGQHPDTPGQIFISPCIDSSNKCTWTMKPNGSVVCSSSNSSIAVSKLVIGGLTITNGYIKGSGGSSVGAHLYSGANNFDGATLQLYSRAHGSYPGHFYLRTSSKSSSGDTAGTSYDIVGKPDGTLTWGGKPIVCVKYYRSGASWYRKYSDGFIEQGGNFSNSARGTTITFPLAFTSTNYQALACINHANNGWTATTTACVRARTTSNMVVQIYYNSSNTTGLNSWYACGY